MWTSIRDVLPFTINKLGIKKDIDKIKICKVAEKKIKEMYSYRIKVLNFKNGNLIVQCDNYTLANELYLNQKKIIKSINSDLKEEKIKQIRFVIKNI